MSQGYFLITWLNKNQWYFLKNVDADYNGVPIFEAIYVPLGDLNNSNSTVLNAGFSSAF